MSIETEGGTADMVNLDEYTAPVPQPSKPKRIAKKTREALEAEFARGYAEAMDRDRGMEMLGSLGLALICAALGVGLGAWIF